MATVEETVVLDDVVASANEIGGYDTSDTAFQTRLRLVARQMITKSEAYIGRPCPVALTDVLGEMAVRQYSNYLVQPESPEFTAVDESLPVKKIVRGDYTVEYETRGESTSLVSYSGIKIDVFGDYEWILKKYKKLKVL